MTFINLFTIIQLAHFIHHLHGGNYMKAPKPRTTEIIESKGIKGLFYEGFKKNRPDEDLIIAFHYSGKRFDLHEIVRIKNDPQIKKPKFRKIRGQPLLGIIVSIEPSNEGDGDLIIRVDDCESEEQEFFMVTEIKKE